MANGVELVSSKPKPRKIGRPVLQQLIAFTALLSDCIHIAYWHPCPLRISSILEGIRFALARWRMNPIQTWSDFQSDNSLYRAWVALPRRDD